MRTRSVRIATSAVLILAIPLAARFTQDERITHALNRLTFGPRPGDLEEVRKTGLKKWIDQQLHPDRIAENPVLEAKLRPMDTLRMTASEMARAYPPPQLIKAMADGRVPYPKDESERERMKQLAAIYEQRQKKDGER